MGKLTLAQTTYGCLLSGVLCLPIQAESVDEQAETMTTLLEMSIEELIKVKVTTIATGAEQSTDKAAAVVSVITAQEIEAMGARTLEEVLETVPGLHIARNNAFYRPIYTIRGISSARNPEVLLLINGIRINNTFEGNPDVAWVGMPINGIARIEVIRGPGSALYGADAFAGVINIVTKTQDAIKGTESGARVGSFSTQEAWVLHGGQYAGFNVAATVEYQETDGTQEIIAEDAQTQYDKRLDTHASLAPGTVNLSQRTLDARLDLTKGHWQWRTGYQERRHLGTGSGMAQALDPEGHFADDRFNTDLTYHNPTLTTYWDITAQVSYFRTALYPEGTIRFLPRGAFGGTYPEGYISNPGVSEAHSGIDLSGFYSRFHPHLLRIGAGYRYDDMYQTTSRKNYGMNPATGLPPPPGSPVIDVTDTPYVFVPEKSRSLTYSFLQDTWTVNSAWELTGGIRYDNYSDFGNTLNPRLALVWQTLPHLTSKLLYGRAFRAPSFAELYITNNPVMLGNPQLRPETINTWELAFDYRATERLRLTSNLFTYDLKDKILYLPDKDKGGAKAQNVGQWQGRGLELEARWTVTDRLSVLANYAYQKATDKQTDDDIGDYPRQTAYLRTDWLFMPQWSLDLSANWVADRQRVHGDTRPAIADYTTVDLTLRYQEAKERGLGFAVSVRNALDADAREPSQGPNASIPYDLPLAGRNYFIELRYQF